MASSASSTASSSAGTVVSISANASVTTNTSIAATTGPCMWYADAKCTRPRSCFDCLNAVRTDGTKCAINPFGQCVPMAQYDSSRDYRVQDASAGVLTNFYPSTNTTYCSQGDSQCARCRALPIGTTASTLSGYVYYSGLLPYCLGANRCVCVAACEAKNWRNNVILRASCAGNSSGSEADSSSITTPSPTSIFQSKQHSGLRPATVLMIISLAGLVFLCVLVRRWWVSHNVSEQLKQRRQHFAQMRLTLEGWNSYRQQLIDAENSQLGVAPKPKPLETTTETLTVVSIQAGEDESEAEAARLVIERGDGYRPVSPSEYDRQRRLRGASVPSESHADQ